MNSADLVAAVATVVAGVSLVPQIVKLIRTGDRAGVSPTWPAIGAVTNGAWTVYLGVQGLWWATPSTALMTVFYGAVLYRLGRMGSPLGAPVTRGLVLAAAYSAITAVGGWTALGLVLGFSLVLQITPSIWTAYRTRVPSGIAAGTWWLAGFEGSLWGYYGWWYADLPIVIFAIVAVVGSTFMLARFYATRHRWERVPAAV